MDEVTLLKSEYLISVGFEQMGDQPTLFRKGNIVMSSSDPNQSLEDLKKDVMSLLKNEDLRERQDENVVEEEQNNENKDMPGEEDPDPFDENREPVEPFYICDELKEVQTPVFVRLTLDDNRYYIRQTEEGGAGIYASATTLIKDGYVDDKTALQEWKQEMKMLGKNPEEVAQYEADKGTIMHYLYGLYLTGRDMVLSRGFIIKTVKEGNLKISKKNLERFYSSVEDLDNMMERLMRFAKFCYEYEVEPMAIEKILSLDEYMVATPIDAIVKMSFIYKEEGYFGEVYKMNGKGFKKGDPKKSVREVKNREAVILDFKSGGIWDSYAFQLEIERRMVEKWYGINARIMNFSPKSSSSKGYTLKEWTKDNAVMEKADCVFLQGMINHMRKNKKFKAKKGVLNIHKPYNEEDYVFVYDIEEEMAKRFNS